MTAFTSRLPRVFGLLIVALAAPTFAGHCRSCRPGGTCETYCCSMGCDSIHNPAGNTCSQGGVTESAIFGIASSRGCSPLTTGSCSYAPAIASGCQATGLCPATGCAAGVVASSPPTTASPTLSPTTSCEKTLMVVRSRRNAIDTDLYPLRPAGVALTDLSQSAMLSLRIELDESFGGSVEFTIYDTQTGVSIPHLENNYPYTLMGDDNNISGHVNYHGWKATVGEHTVAIRIFTGKDRSGELFCAIEETFEVVAPPPTPPVPCTSAYWGTWPAVKGGRVCDKLAEDRGAACAAVIDFSQTPWAATCNEYCNGVGLPCVDADDEKKNKCKIFQKTAATTTCFTPINAAIGTDAICYCGFGAQPAGVSGGSGDTTADAAPESSESSTVATALVVTGAAVAFVMIATVIAVVARRTWNTATTAAAQTAAIDTADQSSDAAGEEAVDLQWDESEL